MPNENQAGAPDGANGTTSSGAAAASGTSATGADAAAAKDAGREPFLSKDEFVQYAKRVQKLEDQNKALMDELAGKGKSAGKKDEAPSEVQMLRQELDFERSMGRLDLSDEQRDFLFDSFKAARPADTGAWLERAAKALGAKPRGGGAAAASGQAAAGSQGAAAAKIQTDLGAASAGGGHPMTPTAYTPAQWRDLPSKTRREISDAQTASKNARNPFFRPR